MGGGEERESDEGEEDLGQHCRVERAGQYAVDSRHSSDFFKVEGLI